jgi:hypothetical protein
MAGPLAALVDGGYLTLPTSTRRAGYVGGYSLDVRNGHAHLMVTMRESRRFTPVAIDACLTFMEFSFAQWPLRKIYMDRPASIGRVAAVERYCEREGLVREHLFLNGGYVDQYIFTMWRSNFEQLMKRYRGSAGEQPVNERLLDSNGTVAVER